MSDIVKRLRQDFTTDQIPLHAEAAAEIERLTAALESCESWIDRWTSHVASCEGGDKCTCGRQTILYEARAALNQQGPQEK